MKDKIYYSLISGILLNSCGAFEAKVDKQPTGSLVLPDYHVAKEGVFLTEGNSKAFYDGSILVWNDLAKTKEIAEIGRTSSEKKDIQARAYQYNKTKVAQSLALTKLQDEIVQINQASDADIAARVDAANAVNDPNLLHKNAANWFAEKVATLNLTEQDLALTQHKLATYCQAKLWQTAANKDIITLSYTSRPTPHAMCENYYAEQGLLSKDSEDCKDNANGQRYVACLWNEGVLKTQFWKDRINSDSLVAATESFSKNYVDTGILEASISSGNFDYGAFLENDYIFEVNFVYDNKLADESIEKKFVQVVSSMNATTVKDQIFGTKTLAYVLKVFENPELLNTPVDTALIFPDTEVNSLLNLMGERLHRTEGEKSVNDFLFNRVRLTANVDNNVILIENDQLQASLKTGNEKYPTLFGGKVTVSTEEDPKFTAQRAVISKKITVLEKDLLATEKKIDVTVSELSVNSIDSLASVHIKNTVLSLWTEANLTIEKSANVYKVAFKLMPKDSYQAYVGCVTADTGKAVKCANLGKNERQASVEHDPKTGRFTLTKLISSKDHFGTAYDKPANTSDPDFNLIPKSNLDNSELRLEVYPAVVGTIPYLTGEFEFKKGEKAYKGSANLSSYNYLLGLL